MINCSNLKRGAAKSRNMHYMSWLEIRNLEVSYLDFHSCALLVTSQTSTSTCAEPIFVSTSTNQTKQTRWAAQKLFSCPSPCRNKTSFHRFLHIPTHIIDILTRSSPPLLTPVHPCSFSSCPVPLQTHLEHEPSGELKMLFHFANKWRNECVIQYNASKIAELF